MPARQQNERGSFLIRVLCIVRSVSVAVFAVAHSLTNMSAAGRSAADGNLFGSHLLAHIKSGSFEFKSVLGDTVGLDEYGDVLPSFPVTNVRLLAVAWGAERLAASDTLTCCRELMDWAGPVS